MQELPVSDHHKICEVQAAFQQVYPFLKIEFFHPFQAKVLSYRKEEQLGGDAVLGKYMRNPGRFVVDISSQRSVAEVEKDFATLGGLRVQVFRKSGNLWIITSLTDDWSLDKQNHEGELLSKPAPKKPLEERVEDTRFDGE